MSKFDRVLSDDDLVDIFALGIGELSAKPFDELVKVLEQAVLKKLAEQEPVAYLYADMIYGTGDADINEHIIAKGEPLYCLPLPCVSNASDKTACVSENRESETQHHLEYIKRYQNWRRGEDKTMSEAGIAPKQIGEALDCLIGVVEDHIPDISNDQDIFRLRQKEKGQREAISEWLELKDKIKKSGRPPHADYWNQAIYEAENKLRLSIQD